MSLWTVILRLLLATLIGGIIGLQREMRGKVAGLRTLILVSLGSCLFMLISIRLFEAYSGVDPSRIVAQVVIGIGFIGAGAVVRAKGAVIGLTTAASIWVTAACGLAVGGGLYLEGGLVAFITLLVLEFLSRVEYLFKTKEE
jgi:putative Mg2+ transporter-C (MgtC) family protein